MVGDILQPTHLLFVLVVALLVLGPKRLPEVARTLGKGIRDFRGAISGETDGDQQPQSFLPREGQPGHYEATEPIPPAPAAATPPAPDSAAAPTPTAPTQPAPAPPVSAEPAAAEPTHPEQAPAPSDDAEHSSAGAPAHHSE